MPTAKIENINTISTGIQLDILREDSLFPDISGNKFRKLKYNIEAAKKQDKKQLISFGGAFSNHIAAVAKAGEKYDFQTFGIIRGEELASKPLNNTLQFATKKGIFQLMCAVILVVMGSSFSGVAWAQVGRLVGLTQSAILRHPVAHGEDAGVARAPDDDAHEERRRRNHEKTKDN